MLKQVHDLFKLRTNPVLFFTSTVIMAVFVVATLIFPQEIGQFWSRAADGIFQYFGWFFIAGVTIFLIFLIYIALSRFGQLRLGNDEDRPTHSNLAWFCMLFAAGIGTILMFWAVAEPANHTAVPPREVSEGVVPFSTEAASEAMGFTLYHFGLHTWTIFTLPGLAFAYFIYKRHLPPRVSSLFQPLLGEGIHGPVGKTIDVFAIVGTIFGVAMSIGLGTTQIHAGLAARFGLGGEAWSMIVIISVVTVIATLSAVLGVDKGIKRLSNFNIYTAILLLLFIIVTGPTVYLLRGVVEFAGVYFSMFPELVLWTETFGSGEWQQGWTIFYWAWTIAWSPFVGIFIARISRGRSVRQFIIGVLGLPTLFTIIWYGVWGTGLFDLEFNSEQPGVIEDVVSQGPETSMFVFLDTLPLAEVTGVVAISLVAVFFITSLDSAALVLDDMCNGYDGDGRPQGTTKPIQRAVWTLFIGLISAVLLVATGEGGIAVLRDVALVFGLPFFILAFFMMYSLLRAMREDAGEVPLLRSRRWLTTLPPEEYERRMDESDDSLAEAVIAPDYAEGTQPPTAPEVQHAEQPELVNEYRRRSGEISVVEVNREVKEKNAEPSRRKDSEAE